MTYDSIERSVQDAQRVEIYTFELPGETFRLTSYDEDVVFDGNAYTKASIDRSASPLVPIGAVREITITIDLDHDLARALRRGGLAPQRSPVTIRRLHIGDSGTRLQWQGLIGGTNSEGPYMTIRVPNKLDLALACQLPATVAQRTCPHVLYDRGCTIDPVAGGWRITPTVASIDGTALVVSSISGKPDHWARYGKVIRASDGEERSVLEQIGTAVTLDYAFRTLVPGDSLELYAGCDLTLDGGDGCVEKFNNVLNFGGDPEMPSGNPTAPTGYGVIEQV